MTREITDTAEANNLFRLLRNPLRIITDGGKYGIKSAWKLFLMVFGFGMLNFVLVLYAVLKLIEADQAGSNMLWIGLMLILGLAFTVFAGYKAYQMAVMDILGMVYRKSSYHLESLCGKIIEKSASADTNSYGTLGKYFDIKAWVSEKFAGLPYLFQKLLIAILNQIPLSSLMKDVQADLNAGNKEAAKSRLYQGMDAFLIETFFETNRRAWILGILIANLLAQGLIIYWILN